MHHTEIDQNLAQIEIYFDSVSDALRSGEPIALLAATSGLKKVAVDFSHLLNQMGGVKSVSDTVLKQRLHSLAEGFAIQRANLVRRTVPVEQALAIIVPASRSSTYQTATSQYSQSQRHSGEFNVIKA